MKKDFYIALIAISLMFLINILGGAINQSLNYYRKLDDLFRLFPELLIIGATYWILARIKIGRMRKSLRLPIIRIIFWGGLLLIAVLTDNDYGLMIGWDNLIDHNTAICFPLATFSIGLRDIYSFINLTMFDLWGIALYEFVIFEIAQKILSKIEMKNKITVANKT